MADTKISALPASTTPLAGTEVLPIVQGGVTKQVSVANLTAGRAVSATQLTLTTENLIIGTSGKGIDFSATAGTGTSELLADYEEGNWTPNLYSAGGGNPTFTSTGKYTKIGRQVTAIAEITLTSTAGAVGYYIDGLPFAAAAANQTSATGVETTLATDLSVLFANTTTLFLVKYDGVFIGLSGFKFQINATYIV